MLLLPGDVAHGSQWRFEIVRDHGTFAIIQNMMAEAQMIAESLGIKFSISADERIEMAAKVGAHRTSMLQDVEAKRKTELDVLLGSVIEFSALTGIAAPTCKMIYDLTRSRITARKRG